MPPSSMVYVGFTEKGSVVLLPDFPLSDVGRAPLVEQGVYLRLAQKANHAPASMVVEGVRVQVDRGEWFGSRIRLSRELRLSKKTLNSALDNLQAIGAIALVNVEKTNRGDGVNPDPSWGRNSPIGRVVGTRVKVFGWKDFAARVSNSGHGSKFPPQVKSMEIAASVRAPRLSAAHRAINAQAMQLVKAGAL